MFGYLSQRRELFLEWESILAWALEILVLLHERDQSIWAAVKSFARSKYFGERLAIISYWRSRVQQ